MTVSRATWRGLAVALGLGFVVLYWGLNRGVTYPFTSDSAAYIDMARSFAEKGELAAVPYGLELTDVARAPVRTWPPLYSILIAAVHATGVPVPTAAVWMNRAAAAALPLLLVVLFEGLAAPAVLLVVGLLALTAPGVRANQYMALSDCLCLFFTVLSIGLALRRGKWQALLASGMSAGCAYATRNAGLGVLLAVPAWFALMAMVLREPKRSQLRDGLIWGVGALCVVGPLFAYNAVTFGSLQPYMSQAPTDSLFSNVSALLGALAGEFAGAYYFNKISKEYWSTALVCLAAVALVLGMFRTARVESEEKNRAALLLLLFAACGAGLVIAASVRFFGIETWLNRQTMQYVWALLLTCGILFNRQTTGRFWPAIPTATLLFVLFRAYDFGKRTALRWNAPDQTLAIAADSELRAAVRTLNATGSFLVSNTPWVFRVEDEVNIRQLIGCNFEHDQLQALEKLQSRGRAVFVVLTYGGPDSECVGRWRALFGTSAFRRTTAFQTGIVISEGPVEPIRASSTR